MFGVGIFELLIIGIVCLIAFGPKQMPVLVRKLAGFYRQFLLLREEVRFAMLDAENAVKNERDTESTRSAQPSKQPKLIEGEK